MASKKPQIKLANPVNKRMIDLEARIRMLESMIYKMANDIDLSTGQLLTLSQILDKYRGR